METDPPTSQESDHTETLFVKITPAMSQEIKDAARKVGVSKSGLVRMAMPLGISRLTEQLGPEMAAS